MEEWMPDLCYYYPVEGNPRPKREDVMMTVSHVWAEVTQGVVDVRRWEEASQRSNHNGTNARLGGWGSFFVSWGGDDFAFVASFVCCSAFFLSSLLSYVILALMNHIFSIYEKFIEII
jgi:hypothetical protein